ncbi:hypothetical protein AMK59_5239, partial [Oryctes borbonicus]
FGTDSGKNNINMDNSWVSDSSSTGFVYFEIDTTPSKVEKPRTETSDFVSFTDHNSSPQIHFKPISYSSPQNFRRGSPRNYHKRGWKQNYGNRSYSPNTSYNSNYNSPRNRSRESYQNFNLSGSFNRSIYSSFLEDPWANLERQ